MKEVRAIIFSDDELELALNQYQQRSPTPALPGSIQSLSIDTEKLTVDLRVAGTRGIDRLLTVSSEEVLCALVEYCRAGNVPVPIRSTKRVQVIGGDLALMISTLEDKRAITDERTLHRRAQAPEAAHRHSRKCGRVVGYPDRQ